MAFSFSFFKSKKTGEASTPVSTPPASLESNEQTSAVGSVEKRPAQSSASKSVVSKVVAARQGSLVTALKAAPVKISASEGQSAVFKPKVNVVLKPQNTPRSESFPSDAPATIEIATAELLSSFPENVFKPGAKESGFVPEIISISTLEIYPQLPRGKVQIPLNTLLCSFPSEAMDPSVAGSGDLYIKIPLHLIIPQLPESMMSLPNDQVTQELEDLVGEAPFSERSTVSKDPAPQAVSAVQPQEPKPIAPLRPPASLPPLNLSKLAPSDAAKALIANIPFPPRPTTPIGSKNPVGHPPLSVPTVKPPQILKSNLVPKKVSAQTMLMPSLNPANKIPPSSALKPISVGQSIPKTVVPSKSVGPTPVSRPPGLATSPGPSIPSPTILKPAVSIPALPKSIEPPKPIAQPPLTQTTTPLSKTSVPVPKESTVEKLALHQLIGIQDERKLRIQDIAEQARIHFNMVGVLIATKDGLPLAGSMPSGWDLDFWSSMGPLLFRKFDKENISHWGRPHRCILSMGDTWITFWNQGGIYLVLSHEMKAMTREFEERNRLFLQELSRYCQQAETA